MKRNNSKNKSTITAVTTISNDYRELITSTRLNVAAIKTSSRNIVIESPSPSSLSSESARLKNMLLGNPRTSLTQ